MKTCIVLLINLFFCSLLAQSQSSLLNRNMYVYNNGKDTIHFKKLIQEGLCLYNTTTIIDTIQIDRIGSKEIVFFRSIGCQINEHGGTFDIDESTSISKYEIWDLDSRKLLFEVVSSYQTNLNKLRAYANPQHIRGSANLSCTFVIDSIGVISISHVKEDLKIYEVKQKTIMKNGKEETVVEETLYPFYMGPVKKEGTYRFVNGEYTFE